MNSSLYYSIPHSRSKRKRLASILESSTMHHLIAALAFFNIIVTLAEIIIDLTITGKDTCESQQSHELETVIFFAWIISLSIVSLLTVETFAHVIAFGWSYYKNWVHCFESLLLVTSLVLLSLSHSFTASEVTLLILLVRFWRIIRLLSETRMLINEHHISQRVDLQSQLDELKRENARLKSQLQ